MLSESELVSYCAQELQAHTGSGDLAKERTKALDYYYGDMGDYLGAGEDRSAVSTRDVLDTVESVLPSLIKIFFEEENAVVFEAVSAEDQEQAELETNAVRTVFFRENPAFLNLYTFFKDALLSKVGIFKTYWEEAETEREEYEGLDPIEADKLLSNPNIDYEVEEYEETPEGINLVILTTKKQGQVVVEPVTPEEFGISSDACSPDPKKARFCWQTTQKTISDLHRMGIDKKKIDEIQFGEGTDGQQRLARRHLSDETDTYSGAHKSMRTVWVTECYPLIDRDEDGIAERLKVTVVSGEENDYANMTLLDVEESKVPFSGATPVILTHKFYGYSLADLVMDIQEIRTTLFRGILDSVYLANNGRMGANENVNLDDLLTVRPGGIVRTSGSDSPGNHLYPIQHPPIPREAFGLLEVLDDMLKGRTGVGDEVAGLDATALANINTGVIMQAYDQARMRIELMARIFAECGLKEVFRDIHQELHANQDKSIQMKIDGQWIDINPGIWREKRRMTVNVGIGNQDKLQKRTSLDEILALQEKALQTGYMTPAHMYNTVSDRLKLDGLDVSRYFPDPNTFQPPKQENPMLMLEMAKLDLDKQRLAVDGERVRIDAQIKMRQAESKERETAIRGDIESMKGQMQLQKMAIDEQSQLTRAQNEVIEGQVDSQLKVRAQELAEEKARLDAFFQSQAQLLDKYKAELSSTTQLETKIMEIMQRSESETLKHIQTMSNTLKAVESRLAERP